MPTTGDLHADRQDFGLRRAEHLLREPLIRLSVDLHRRAGIPVRDVADVLIDPLLGYVPSLAKMVAENGENLIERARTAPDCDLGELIAHVALALENQAAPAPPAPSPLLAAGPAPGRGRGAVRLRIRGDRP